MGGSDVAEAFWGGLLGSLGGLVLTALAIEIADWLRHRGDDDE